MTSFNVEPSPAQWPAIRTVGIDAMLVSFGDALSEPANRAALAFRAALDGDVPDGVEETSTSLVSAFVKFDPLHLTHEMLRSRLSDLLADRDWYQAPLPQARRLWRVPAVFGTTLGPQLGDAAHAAGLDLAAAIASLTAAPVRVQTIGFAPGQPYLGPLPAIWDIPRQKELNPRVPEGALIVAIRQLVLFSVTAPTGWLHIGQTAFRLFRPDSEVPFVLRPGDEITFQSISPEALNHARAEGPDGGATSEVIA